MVNLKTHKDLQTYLEKTNDYLWFEKGHNGVLIISGYTDILFFNVKKIPGNVCFKNEGSVFFYSLEFMPNDCCFDALVEDVEFFALKELPKKISFRNMKNVIFNNLHTLVGSTCFANGGDVEFNAEIHHIGRSEISFKNSGSVFFKKLKNVVKSLHFKNSRDVFICRADKVVEGFNFNNSESVYINAAELGEKVCFNNTQTTEVRGTSIIPNRCQFQSDEVILPDITEIKSRGAFRNCYNVEIPKYTIQSNRISFANIIGTIKVKEIKSLPKTCSIQHAFSFNRFVVKGALFENGTCLKADVISDEVKERLNSHLSLLESSWMD